MQSKEFEQRYKKENSMRILITKINLANATNQNQFVYFNWFDF